MKFCDNCDNMYYIGLDKNEPNKLNYFCRNCKHVDELLPDGMCVLNTNFKSNDNNYHYIVNKYTKFDPTLPHIYNIPCPNDQCKSNTSDDINNDIIYLRYDTLNMKYIYICTNCDTKWKTNEQK